MLPKFGRAHPSFRTGGYGRRSLLLKSSLTCKSRSPGADCFTPDLVAWRVVGVVVLVARRVHGPSPPSGRAQHVSHMLFAVLLVAAPAAAMLHGTAPHAVVRRTCRPQLRLTLLGDPEQPPPPSEKVVAAVEAVYQRQPEGTRLTAADLAAQGGISVDEARVGLKELATALAGADGVSVSASSKGDLLYGFPSDVRQELASLSNAAKLRDAWNSAKPALQTVGRGP
jgi:hypothetical protein